MLIVVNTIQLMMFDPFDTSANIEPAQVFTRKAWPPLGRDLLAQIGLVLSALFVLEALIKILALGFVRGSKTYLAQRSNWLDFFVVLIGCIDFAGDEVDIGAASAIYDALIALRDRGAAILVISEDTDELFTICDRVGALFNGQLSPVKPIQDTSIDEVGKWMAGVFEPVA